MTFIAFLIGGMIGFSTCAIFSARQYDKGYEDGVRRYGEKGLD